MGNSTSNLKQSPKQSGPGQSRRSGTGGYSGRQAARNMRQDSTSTALTAPVSPGQQAPVASRYGTVQYYATSRKPALVMKELYKLDKIAYPNREHADFRTTLNIADQRKQFPNGLPGSQLNANHHHTQGFWEGQSQDRLERERNFWLRFRAANETTDDEERRLKCVLFVLWEFHRVAPLLNIENEGDLPYRFITAAASGSGQSRSPSRIRAPSQGRVSDTSIHSSAGASRRA